MSVKHTLRATRHLFVLAALMSKLVAPVLAQQPPALADATSVSTSAAGWIPTGNLNIARAGHTATLLTSGKVLVTGGWAISAIASAELYDPASGTWSVTGSMNSPRGGHTATLLSDGRVLVAGGAADGSAELYNPDTSTWTPTGSMTISRFGHTATRLGDGRVLVAGGEIYGDGNVTASAELYDPVTGSWTSTGALKVARSGHTATMLPNGKILVLGGWLPSDGTNWDQFFSSTEIYDPLSGTWTSAGSLAVPRVFHSATLLPNGKVLVTGGYKNDHPGGVTLPQSVQVSELFDPATGTLTGAGDLNVARESATATLLASGEVLVAGGLLWHSTKAFDTNYITEVPSGRVVTDSQGAQWHPVGQLTTPRHDHTATLLQDGRVLVAGGSVVARDFSAITLASAELYGNFASGAIVPAFTGSWFDPTQNGHGLLIEVLPNSQFLAAWFTFNPAGTTQAWFIGVGTYINNTATIANVILPSGGRWIPNFDPTKIVDKAWGTLKFTFTDCNHGKVEFASSSGYGMGSMNLTRLTQPAGLTCP